MSSPFISIDIATPGDQNISHIIDDSSIHEAYDPNEIHPVAKKTNLSYEFSGRHDTGYLANLKSNPSHLNSLVIALQEAKKFTDKVLTEKINNLYGYDDEKPPLLPEESEVNKHLVKMDTPIEVVTKKPKIEE